MRDRFYFACFRDNVGRNVAWHAKNGRGYVSDISKAHVYDRTEAQAAYDFGREFDCPISADHVDSLSYLKVDFQHVPGESLIDDSEKFVAFYKEMFSGNDLYFRSDSGATLSFSIAKKYTKSELKALGSDFVVIPYCVADRAARKTFDLRDFNRRVMVQGAGIKIPSRIKKEKRRSSRGLTRMNCPACGKINWQQDPYDFSGCSDLFCSEHGREVIYE